MKHRNIHTNKPSLSNNAETAHIDLRPRKELNHTNSSIYTMGIVIANVGRITDHNALYAFDQLEHRLDRLEMLDSLSVPDFLIRNELALIKKSITETMLVFSN